MRLRPHALALALSLVLALPAVAATPRPAPARPFANRPGAALVKQRQAFLMAQEPMRERAEAREFRERARELRRLARHMRSQGRTTLRAGGEGARPALLDEDVRAGRPARATAADAASAPATLAAPTNVRCNDPSGDTNTADGQCETSIARWNQYLVAAWNDGKGYDDGTDQTQGWATSTDGGATWTDQGTFPLPTAYATTWKWSSDPVVAVNATTGAFYFTALGGVPGSLSGIGVLRGRFTGTTFAWNTVSVARIGNQSTDYLDKEWLAVDPVDGRAYLAYSDFKSTGSEIHFQWADSSLASWSSPVKLSTAAENGWVQGARPAVGPGNNVYVVWYEIGQVDVDTYVIARSSDRGVTFGTPVNGPTFYSNYGTGAPGFNRGMGIQFPSVAVDRSGGAYDGRIYLGWAESLNWYDDQRLLLTSGTSSSRSEVEPNNTAATATPAGSGSVTLRGAMNTTTDLDYWAVSLTAGQTILVQADSMTTGMYCTLRMFGPDGLTRLAYLDADASSISAYGPAPWIFTAPTTATYYIRVAAVSGLGNYRLRMAPAARTTERGRDQRDVFVTWSDDRGATWATPQRVNQEAVGYDDWLPEVAVSPNGEVACAWYDWRDAPVATGGGESSIYLATSLDGGATWTQKGAMSTARSAWTNVATNIAPNQGDYFSLVSTGDGSAVCWSDGRDLNPNVYMAWIMSDVPAAAAPVIDPCSVTVSWSMAALPAGSLASLYRRAAGAATWDSLGQMSLSATHVWSWTDASVTQGTTYQYRLGYRLNSIMQYFPATSVTVPYPALPANGSCTSSNNAFLLDWTLARNAGTAATLYRRTLPAGNWVALATLQSDATLHLTYTDANVSPDSSYQYRLGVMTCGVELFGDALDATLTLAITRITPNPAVRGSAASRIHFTLGAGGPATIEFLDVSGRRAWSGRATGSSLALSEVHGLAPGVYVVRITQGGNSVRRRIVVL